MRSIQEVGKEVLEGNPKSFYIFAGPEYGIKVRYIQLLCKHYNSNYECYDKVSDVLDMMSVKHLVPLQPKVYVVRYDESFLSTLSQNTEHKIKSYNIIGTLVCIYEQEKHVQKVSKYLPNYTVSIDCVSPQFVKKYLHLDFPGLADELVDIAIECSHDYGQARLICQAMKSVDASELLKLSEASIRELFGNHNVGTEFQLKMSIACRNFKYCENIINNMPDVSKAYYTILQTMIDLEKIKTSKYSDSPIRKYSKLWTMSDIYNMYQITYEELKQSRSLSFDIRDSLTKLFCLLCFKSIPSKEAVYGV